MFGIYFGDKKETSHYKLPSLQIIFGTFIKYELKIKSQ